MKKIFFLISMLFLITTTSTFGIVASQKLKADDCAQIVMKNGDIVQANIIQITSTDIKYKRCGKPNDPEISISKKEVLSVKAADGETIYRNNGKMEVENNERKTNGMAIASMITGILSLLLSFSGLGIILGILGIIFGAVGLKQIKKNPEKYKGKGMAKAGLICGIIACAIYALVILVFLAA